MVERVIEIAAPQEFCFEVISDLEKYPEFLKTTSAVKTSPKAGGVVAKFEVSIVKTISYTLDFKLEKPGRIAWKLIQGDMMKKNSGAWIFEPMNSQRTKCTYQIDVEFGWLVPKSIVEMLTTVQLPDLMASFQERVESLYAGRKSKEQA